MILFILLPIFVLIHIIEEFVFPGGFRKWYQNYDPSIGSSLTIRFLVIINFILVIVSLIPFLIGSTEYAIALWLTISAILFSNSLFHIIACIKSKLYNPGVITSIILYLPISIYGYWFYLYSGQSSYGTAIIAFALGSSYQWWSLYNHKKRSGKIGSKNL